MHEMEIEYFKKEFKKQVTRLQKLKAIEENGKRLGDADWTFLISCAVYELVKEYNDNLKNKNKKNKVRINIEPKVDLPEKDDKPRWGWLDFLIHSENEDYIAIEHEIRLGKDAKTGEDILEKDILKLAKFDAKHKLLIAYYNKKKGYSKGKIRKICEESKRKFRRFFKPKEIIHLLIANYHSDYEKYKSITI